MNKKKMRQILKPMKGKKEGEKERRKDERKEERKKASLTEIKTIMHGNFECQQ